MTSSTDQTRSGDRDVPLSPESLSGGESLREFFEAVPDAMLLVDEGHRIVMVNTQLLDLFGYTTSELVGQPIDILVPDRFHATHHAHRRRYQARPERRPMGALLPDMLKGLRRDGSEIPVDLSLSPIRVGDEPCVVCSVRDLAGGLEKWQRMTAQRDKILSQVFDAIPAMAFTFETEGHTLRANDALLNILGWSAEELLRDGLDRCIPDVRARARARKLITNPAPGQHDMQLECRDGRRVESTWSVVRMSPLIVVAVGMDVTEKVELEDRLRQSEKMKAVGQLAGGVAHDFNNLLTVISGRGQMLLQNLRQGGLVAPMSDVREILQAAESATALTRQLLTFSRGQQPKLDVISPKEVAVEVEGLLIRLLPDDIELEVHATRCDGRIVADRSHIEQILLNLVVNARDAMEGGGRLTITVEDVRAEESEDVRDRLSPGPYVLLSVTDSGCGMEEAVLSKVFDPFFTTKGHGTGLGLATVHNVVEAAEGLVTIESAPGEGTTVRVYLPCVEEAETPAAGVTTCRPETSPTSSGTILVVEDSAGVRKLMADVLRGAGHTVLEASDGEEGLRTAETAPDSLDLVVTDVVMPRMRGPAMVALLRERQPGLKVLYVSGHTNRGWADIELDSAGTELLPKPFEPSDLLRRIGEMLSPNQPSAAATPQEPV